MKPLTTLQEKLVYTFKTPRLLQEALTHKSFAHEKTSSQEMFAHNERLEFLGDAVLDLAISSLLMDRDFHASEGELSKRRASLVNEATLAEVAREMKLSDFIVLGHGEIASKGGEKNSILASALEAILGAVYLDSDLKASTHVVAKLFATRIEELSMGKPFFKDYKTRLQEIIQSKHKVVPNYKIVTTSGPEHQKTFQVAVHLGEKKLGEGIGRSRKEAEQEAARIVLEDKSI